MPKIYKEHLPGLPALTLGFKQGGNMSIHEKIIRVQGREYKIEIDRFFMDATLCWVAYRRAGDGWEKIPSFTRAEERRFPKMVGYAAGEILNNYKRKIKEVSNDGAA